MPETQYSMPLLPNLVSVTEAAAKAAWAWIGRGDKHAIDAAGTQAMRQALSSWNCSGRVVIGEGEMDEAPMLYIGEQFGLGGIPIDIAVDPIEGTDAIAAGRVGGLAVIAISEQNGLLGAPDIYMKKLVVGAAVAGKVHLDDPIQTTLNTIAQSLEKHITELCVVVQERPRHEELVKQIRGAGARVRLTLEGDVMAALEVALPESGIHAMIGIGGAPEGVITAAALRGLGGEIQARFCPSNSTEQKRCLDMGLEIDRVYTTTDLAPGQWLGFAASSITGAGPLQAITRRGNRLQIHSLMTSYPRAELELKTSMI